MRRNHKGGGPEEAVGERRVDVVAAFSLCGDEEGQGAVRRQDVHAAVLLAVPGHQRDAALLHIQVRSHWVQSLREEREQGEEEEEEKEEEDEEKEERQSEDEGRLQKR